MRTIFLSGKDQFRVISDVHLRDPADHTTQQFIALLKNSAHLDAIFLLGDIFDFFATSKFFYKMWENVFDAFCDLKKNGVAVYFIEGNHDFGFEHSHDPYLKQCFTECGDMTVELNHSTLGKIILRHGDDIVCPKSYLPFRKIVKSYVFQKLALWLIPGFFMQFLFSRYAKISRSQEKYRPMSVSFLKACLGKYFSGLSTVPSVLIIGHIHFYIDQKFDQTQILCGPDWFSAASYLDVFDNGSFQRTFLGENTCQMLALSQN